MERKSVRPAEFKLAETGEVEVAFAKLGVVDHDGDVVEPGSTPIGKEVALSAYGHATWLGEMPVGKGVILEDAGWAIFRGTFFLDTADGLDTYRTVKNMGSLQEWSFGYVAESATWEETADGIVRHITKYDAWEVSPVLVGAGIATHTRSIKGRGGLAGVPFADALEWVTLEVSALVDRTRDRAELRTKEGRVLSTANRDRLSEITKGLRSATSDLETILAETDPAAKAITGLILGEIARAEGLGVRLSA